MFFFYQEFHVRQDPYLYMPTAANNRKLCLGLLTFEPDEGLQNVVVDLRY